MLNLVSFEFTLGERVTVPLNDGRRAAGRVAGLRIDAERQHFVWVTPDPDVVEAAAGIAAGGGEWHENEVQRAA